MSDSLAALNGSLFGVSARWHSEKSVPANPLGGVNH
jgi:hypothetical protein